MTRKNLTRNALFTSIISLLLCVSMLVGTTFAWFTDEVVSANNIIKSGNLDITLEYWDGDSWENVSGATDVLTGNLWEPGYVDVAYLRLKNAGSLALQYNLGVNIVGTEEPGVNLSGASFKLSDYIYYDVIEGVNGQTSAYSSRGEAMKRATETTKISVPYSKSGSLESGSDYVYLAMIVYMPESVENEANHNGVTIPAINLGINVFAQQYTSEQDSFDKYYDYLGEGGIATGKAPEEGSTKEYPIYSTGSNVKVGTMNINASSVEDLTKDVEIRIIPTDEMDSNVQIDADTQNAASYEITVSNLKPDNDTSIKVQLQIGTGLSGVKVYHKGVQITEGITYDPQTGYVTFNTKSFSPYTVVYDKVTTNPDKPELDESKLPKAEVTPYTIPADIEWGNYGQWSPNPELEATLEAAYKFKGIETEAEAANNPYANWHCDFYVSLDRDLGENQIFLGGNYGDFGWIGFHNGDVTLNANQELPLLGSVTNSPWTYLDIATFVGEFICGVGDVDGALSGATFTVHLRLTNPDDASDFVNVATITHKFN